MADIDQAAVFMQTASVLFEANNARAAARKAVDGLRALLNLHRVIVVSTHTGVPRIAAYSGPDDFTERSIEDYFLRRLDTLRPLLKLSQPIFYDDYPNLPTALFDLVRSGSASVALIPYTGSVVSELKESGLIAFHRHRDAPPWSPETKQTLIGVSQLIFMGMQRLHFFEETQRLLDTDELTRTGSRRAFVRDIQARLQSGESLCLAVFDFDDFKRINDRHGHLAGDRVLRDIAHGLCRSLTPRHAVYRLGGDEFAVILALENPAEAEGVVIQVLKRIRSQCEDPHSRASRVSLGCAGTVEAGRDLDALIALADRRMYDDKRRRKNTGQAAGPPAEKRPGPRGKSGVKRKA